MKTLSVQIEQLWVPDSLDEDGAAEFLAAVDVARQVRVQTWGNDDLAYTPEEFLEAFNDPYERLVVLLAKIGPDIVGRAGISMPLAENTGIAIVSLEILPRYQGGGVGRELLDAAEHFARGEMRRTVLVETHHPGSMLKDTDGRVVAAAYGDGVLPVASREVAFARRTGYELQQVERFSSCALPLDGELLENLKQRAVEVSGPDYAIHTWTNTCPAEWIRDMAVLEDLMGGEESFSAYGAGDEGEQVGEARDDDTRGDDARVREAETLASGSGRQTMVCAVEHRPTGRLVGFTAISILGHRDDVVFQDDTLVLQEHRGRKLGMVIRVCNLERLALEQPAARRLYAWNAAEKDYMAAVNDALGFATAGYTGEWRKQFDA